MASALKKLAPQWHAEAIALLTQNFDAIHANFLDSTKKAVWLGTFLNYIKEKGKADGSIPHGQFMDWFKNAVPALSDRSARIYMELSRNVCEKGKFQISYFAEFAQGVSLPPAIEQIIEGKTQHQLMLEFKNPEPRNEHHPRKNLSPVELEKAEQDQAEALLNGMLSQVQLIHDNVISKGSSLVSRIKPSDWKNAVKLVTALNKVMKPLAKKSKAQSLKPKA